MKVRAEQEGKVTADGHTTAFAPGDVVEIPDGAVGSAVRDGVVSLIPKAEAAELEAAEAAPVPAKRRKRGTR